LGTGSPAARATPPKPSKKRQVKTGLPADFGISDRVREWAQERGFDRLDEHLDSFKRKAIAKGYTYASWDDAFMEAIREDWAKLRVPQRIATGHETPYQRAQRETIEALAPGVARRTATFAPFTIDADTGESYVPAIESH